nr:glycosyltransferase [uncultured Albidiferax sp.]
MLEQTVGIDCRNKPTTFPKIVVVVPVYLNVGLTRACLASAMPAVMRIPGAKLVAINDASPESAMTEMLALEEARWPGKLITLENETNLGFVKTANKGIQYDFSADVVLLNNDVILPDFWLERLVEEIHTHADAGTITPLSNNTTISSFPNFMKENTVPFELDLERIDETFRARSLDPVEAPTGIGFCLYIRRGCIEEVGALDENSFGTGYGEENDFCQRALRKGWKSYITPNLYVYHRGGVSFQSQRDERIRHADQVLNRRYPSYHIDIQAFVVKDTLRLSRLRRYFDLVQCRNLPVVLHVSHGLGGGVDQHIQDLAQRSTQRMTSLILRPEHGGSVISIGAWDADASMRIFLNMKDGLDLILPFLKAVGVNLVHFHHTLGFPLNFLSIGTQLNVRQIFTCHDFYLINSNPTLTNEHGLFDFNTLDKASNPLYPLPKGMSAEVWRLRHQDFINKCAFIIFPSHSTYEIFSKFFKIKYFVVAYHAELTVFEKNSKPFKYKDFYTVGVLGALSREKGADLLEALAKLAKKNKINVKFTLIGYAYRTLKNIKTIGQYKNNQINKIIDQENCDIILFPALWPETYSYTLSSAITSGLPIMAPSIGSFPERLAARHNTHIYKHPTSTEMLMQDLCFFLSKLESGKDARAPIFITELPLLKNYYDNKYYNDVGSAKELKDSSALQSSLTALFLAQIYIKRGGREKFLRMLWPVYSHPKLQFFFNLIPHRLKRNFKRLLSNKPLHDLMRRN